MFIVKTILAQHCCIFNAKSVASFFPSQHSRKITKINTIRKQYKHFVAFDWQKCQLKLTAINHIQLPDVESLGHFRFS